jgi:transposase
MPDDLAAVYKRVGGATAIAEHYGVPRHTVQGWLRRLRAEGIIPVG